MLFHKDIIPRSRLCNLQSIIITKVNEIVYKPLKENNGSISAEHGIGLDKKNYLIKSRSKSEIELMKQIKQLFDPKNILNPGRII